MNIYIADSTFPPGYLINITKLIFPSTNSCFLPTTFTDFACSPIPPSNYKTIILSATQVKDFGSYILTPLCQTPIPIH